MRFTFLAVATVISVGATAATLPFTVKAPAWTKIAKCTAIEGINIRKAPSVTAPRMAYNETKIYSYEDPVIYSGYWGSKTGGNIQPVLFSGIAPVVEEEPEWVELYKWGPKRESNGWVSKKYCKVSEIIPISTSGGNVSYPCFLLLDTDSSIEGNYGIYVNCDEMEGLAEFYVGRIADGKLICPYLFSCDYNCMTEYDESCTVPFVKEEYRYTFNSTKATTTARLNEYDSMEYTVDLHKFTPEMLNLILREATPLETPATVYCCDDGYFIEI